MEKAKGCECNLAALCCVHPTVLAVGESQQGLTSQQPYHPALAIDFDQLASFNFFVQTHVPTHSSPV